MLPVPGFGALERPQPEPNHREKRNGNDPQNVSQPRRHAHPPSKPEVELDAYAAVLRPPNLHGANAQAPDDFGKFTPGAGFNLTSNRARSGDWVPSMRATSATTGV